MSIALLSAMRSKDKKTQNGACIVDKNKRIVGTGYNGLPRGLDDNNSLYWEDNDEDITSSKHTYVVHAEANAIYNKNSADISKGTMYVTLFPCTECAKAIIQNGISSVIYINEKPHHTKNNEAVKRMFEEAGVSITTFSNLAVKDKELIDKLQELN